MAAGVADDDNMAEELIQENPNDIVQAPEPAARWSLLRWCREQKLKVEVNIRNPKLKIKGKVQNNEIEDTNNTRARYVAFRGIPYAMPPTDEYRFQATRPLPVTPSILSRAWNAYDDKQPCVQRTGDKDTDAYGEEDCLYLNIYMPREPNKIDHNLPVLVLFHGGNHEDVTPDSIMKHDLIFVTVTYRMGPVGFLNMQTQSCRGNMGLKDQTQALRWIQDNIKRFKGDPNNVTISGHGASGTCVNFHLISPLSQGLFHKAIVSGGGIFCPFGFKGHRQEFQEIIKHVTGKDKNKDDEKDDVKEEDTLEYKARKVITDLFMQLSSEEFIKCADAIMDDYVEDENEPTELTAYLGPSIEIEGKYRFLNESIDEMMMKATPVPILAGIAKNEGNQVYLGLKTDDLVTLVVKENYFSLFLQHHFQWTVDQANTGMRKIKDKYFGRTQFDAENPDHYPAIEQGLVNLHTDISHRRFYDNFRFGPAKTFPPQFYVYEFDFYDNLNEKWRRELEGSDYRDDHVAGHGDELLYLYCPKKIRDRIGTFNADVERKIKQMCSLWANFCKDGIPKVAQIDNEPEIVLKPHTDIDQQYLHIGRDLTMRKGWLNQDRWDYLRQLIGEEPKLESLHATPTTPEPPLLLTPNWQDPESVPIIDTWKPTKARKGSGASSVLTRRSSKSSSRRASHRASISSYEHPIDVENAGMSIAATARNFGVGMLRRLSGYRVQPSDAVPEAQSGERPRTPIDSPDESSSPQPGPSSARDDIELQPLPRQSETASASRAQEQLPQTPSSHVQRFRQQQLQAPSSPSASSHDDSLGPLIRQPRSSWWARILRRRQRSEVAEESYV